MLEGLNYYEASIEEQLGAISPIDLRYTKSFAPCNHFEDKMVAFSHGACLEDPVLRGTGLLLPQVCTCVHIYVHMYVCTYILSLQMSVCMYVRTYIGMYYIISSYVIIYIIYIIYVDILCPHSYIQMYVRMYVCAVCTYVIWNLSSIHICTYVYTYVYTMYVRMYLTYVHMCYVCLNDKHGYVHLHNSLTYCLLHKSGVQTRVRV